MTPPVKQRLAVKDRKENENTDRKDRDVLRPLHEASKSLFLGFDVHAAVLVLSHFANSGSYFSRSYPKSRDVSRPDRHDQKPQLTPRPDP